MADRTGRAPTTVRRSLRVVIPALVVLAVVAVFALRAVNAAGAETDRYATATVTRGTITETYAGTGPVAKTDQESVSFPAAAKVTSVEVGVGDKVEAGDELATIDDTALELAVIEAKQTLADAEVSLDNAQEAADEASASATASPTPTVAASSANTSRPSTSVKPSSTAPRSSAKPSASPSGSQPSGGQPTGGSPSSGPTATVPQLTDAVTRAQADLAALNARAAADLVTQQERCGPLFTGGATVTPTVTPTTDTPTPTGTAIPTGTTTPSATSSATTTPSATATQTPSATPTTPTPTATPVPSAGLGAIAACITAVVSTQQSQVRVANQQAVVDRAVTALVAAVNTSGGGSTGGGSTGGSTGGQGGTAGRPATGGSASQARTGSAGAGATRPSTSSTTSGSQGGQGGQTTTVGAAEAAVTKADTALTTAEAELDATTMTAPISGVVSALPFAKGDTASTSDEVTIIGKGSVQVVMAVPETSFRTLEVGMTATVSTAGGGTTSGKVTQRALLPTTSTGSTAATFPVTVAATAKSASSLAAGDVASVTVKLATAQDVLVLPVSAVTRDAAGSSSGSVQVLEGGAVQRKTVTLGGVGTATVEVVDGLTEGQVVVIADNDTALPTTSSTRLRTGGGAGGFAGGTGGPPAGGAPPGGR